MLYFSTRPVVCLSDGKLGSIVFQDTQWHFQNIPRTFKKQFTKSLFPWEQGQQNYTDLWSFCWLRHFQASYEKICKYITNGLTWRVEFLARFVIGSFTSTEAVRIGHTGFFYLEICFDLNHLFLYETWKKKIICPTYLPNQNNCVNLSNLIGWRPCLNNWIN